MLLNIREERAFNHLQANLHIDIEIWPNVQTSQKERNGPDSTSSQEPLFHMVHSFRIQFGVRCHDSPRKHWTALPLSHIFKEETFHCFQNRANGYEHVVNHTFWAFSLC